MTFAAVIAILTPVIAAVAPLLGKWALRRWEKSTTKNAEYEKAKHENGKVVAGDDDAQLNARIEHLLNGVRPPNDGSSR